MNVEVTDHAFRQFVKRQILYRLGRSYIIPFSTAHRLEIANRLPRQGKDRYVYAFYPEDDEVFVLERCERDSALKVITTFMVNDVRAADLEELCHNWQKLTERYPIEG